MWQSLPQAPSPPPTPPQVVLALIPLGSLYLGRLPPALETPCGMEAHTDFSDQRFPSNSFFAKQWTLGVVSLHQKGACDTQSPKLKDDTFGYALAWVILTSKTRAHSGSVWLRREEPCSQGNKCLGAGGTKLVGMWPVEGSTGWGWPDG